MPLFFAYGTELDRARLLAKTLADPPEQVKREAAVSAAGEVAAGAEAASSPPDPMGPPNPTDAGTCESANTPFFNYAARQPLASGYAVGMSLAFRRGVEDPGQLVTDLCPDAGARTWGVLFELSEETLTAICTRFDEARTCEMRTIDVTKLLSGWRGASSDMSDLPGRTVEASCLVAKDTARPRVDADERMLRKMAACYAEYDADISDIRALLPATTSSIDNVRKGRLDLAERTVDEIYYKAPPRYAIYRSGERVMVQYADAATVAEKQRADVAPLNTLRSQVAGLVDGFDRSWFPSVADRGKRYNAQVAAALNQRLEGDMASPQLTLADIKTAILSERESWGRFQYLLSAFVTAVILCTVFWLLKDHWFKPVHPTAGLWLAARAGTVGAFFSIASNIQQRKVATDLHKRDNIADSMLRIVVGAIGAGVLLSLLDSGLLPMGAFGNTSATGRTLSWEVILVVGFIAGFSERMVPSIVDRISNQAEGASAASPKPTTGTALQTTTSK